MSAHTAISHVDSKIQDMLASGDFLISELVDSMLYGSVASHTSDVHIEPTKRGIRVRYRIDGIFSELTALPSGLHDQIVSRIKVMANLISHQKMITQEGRISLERESQKHDLRVSIIPTITGEKVVLRLFSATEELLEFEGLGYTDELIQAYEKLLFSLRGMVIMTGPSGSGKTTTLYASMKRIQRKLDRFASLITLEDPVEYEFDTFCQMPVNRQQGLDFSAGLRAILRQDPEVIMVGEIRDHETCEVALRAGLTGHMVLTTIHAGSSCEVITRLLNMGMEPFIVASAISGVVAQRLVRTICESCKQEVPADAVQQAYVKRLLKREVTTFYEGKGCDECRGTGYSGRRPVVEFLIFDDGLRSLILKKAATSELRDYCVRQGMRTLQADAMVRVIDGDTTIEEVFRNVPLHDFGKD